MESLNGPGHVGVAGDGKGTLSAEIAVVLEDHDPWAAGGHSLQHPIVEAIDVEREQINLASKAMALDQRIDVLRRDRNRLE